MLLKVNGVIFYSFSMVGVKKIDGTIDTSVASSLQTIKMLKNLTLSVYNISSEATRQPSEYRKKGEKCFMYFRK